MRETPEDWRTRAQCGGAGVEMQPDRATEAEVMEARRVCPGCPVWDQCRGLADSQMPGTYGVHAGEWWGPDPVWLVDRVCEHGPCEVSFRAERDTNRGQRFCSPAHRVAASRSRELSA